jgi:hypothetical protein
MASSAGQAALQARRQALINLALKRDPIPLRQKSVVTFVNDPPPAKSDHFERLPRSDSPVNELPSMNTRLSVISTPQIIIDELPPTSPIVKLTSARTLSTMSPIS